MLPPPPPKARRQNKSITEDTVQQAAGDEDLGNSCGAGDVLEALARDWDEEELIIEKTDLKMHLCLWLRRRCPEETQKGSQVAPLILLCLHGAGDVAEVWASVASLLTKDPSLALEAIIAPDLRGHGLTVGHHTSDAIDGNDGAMSIERLVEDIVELACVLQNRFAGAELALVGHSLGGAIAARVAAAKVGNDVPIRALVLVDAVEGTAIDGFDRTATWLQTRPRSFQSKRDAAAWALSSKMLQSQAAAEMAIPPRLVWDSTAQAWTWRTDVLAARGAWSSWFTGLSQIFAALSMPKLLVVGGLERLDPHLEAAHMQGRFKLELLPHPGHQLPEDRPEELASMLGKFLLGIQRQRAAFAHLCANSGEASVKRACVTAAAPT